MAVTKIATRKRWIGLAADTKPTITAGDDVSVGSTFLEYDSKDVFITYDGENWTKYRRNSSLDMASETRRGR